MHKNAPQRLLLQKLRARIRGINTERGHVPARLQRLPHERSNALNMCDDPQHASNILNTEYLQAAMALRGAVGHAFCSTCHMSCAFNQTCICRR